MLSVFMLVVAAPFKKLSLSKNSTRADVCQLAIHQQKMTTRSSYTFHFFIKIFLLGYLLSHRSCSTKLFRAVINASVT
jgi:hypothetical protein